MTILEPTAAELDDAVLHLQRMIRVDTVNPPGNELQLARYLDSVLSAEGIETHLLEPVPGRAALVARLRGAGSRPPLLLTAHMDVVGVEPAAWSVDPFGGEIRGGYVYGRGAIDDKGMLAAALMALLVVHRRVRAQGYRLERDLVLAATADEETGGEYGIGWLIERHPDLLRAEYAINEGGRIRVVNGQPLYAAVQTAEKVANVVTVRATGPAGHASVPLEGNAIARLLRAVGAIAAHREPVTLVPTTRGFFTGLASVWPDAREAQAMRDLVSADAGVMRRGAAVLAGVPLLDAVMRSGISPTVFNAGTRHNVIPAHASATLSVRTLPGDPIDAVVARLRDVVADPAIEITITDRGLDAPASSAESPAFRAIADTITALDPRIVTVPYMSTGATESARLRAWGVQTFGILPFPMPEDDERRMHGADERVSLDSFHFGVRTLLGVVERTQRA